MHPALNVYEIESETQSEKNSLMLVQGGRVGQYFPRDLKAESEVQHRERSADGAAPPPATAPPSLSHASCSSSLHTHLGPVCAFAFPFVLGQL